MQPWLVISDEDRLREEDPLTDYFLPVADNLFRANRSRFEFDLNRVRDRALSRNPEDTWGLTIWKADLPEDMIETSLVHHDRFYAQVKQTCDELIRRHGKILFLDLHSFNHIRSGPGGAPGDHASNPDIDLGVTELNRDIYGDLVDRFADRLRSVPIAGRTPDVRENSRFPDGGNFPEWLHRVYGDAACVLTLEYKKVFMDEWTGTADILMIQRLRQGLLLAVEEARRALGDIA